MRARVSRNSQPNIQALRDGNRKVAAAGYRLYLKAVDGDQLPIELTEINMIGAHRRAIDDPEQHLHPRLSLDHLRISKRAVVSEEGIVFDIVQIERGRRRSAARTTHARHRFGLFKLLENLLRRREA